MKKNQDQSDQQSMQGAPLFQDQPVAGMSIPVYQSSYGYGNQNDQNQGNVAFTGRQIPQIPYQQSTEQSDQMTYMAEGLHGSVGPHGVDPNKLKIVAVHKENDNIAAVKFNTGQIVPVEQAIAMTEAGLIEDMNTGATRGNKAKTLRSYPDGDPSNNLDNLPQF